MTSKLSLVEQRCWELLDQVCDPEFPISLVELGLVYDIKEKEGNVEVTMTFTSTACACMEWIKEDVDKALRSDPEVRHVNIKVVWDPPWTADRMTAAGKQKMKRWGVSS
jgi:metal-sulfur cluster biosynthetic enzyme